MSSSFSKPRLAAFHSQGGHCFYCGAPVWLDQPEEFAKRYGISKRLTAHLQCTGEHLTAKQDGGGRGRSNIVAACRFCNLKRHARKVPPSPEEYQRLVQRRIQSGKWHPVEIRRLLTTRAFRSGMPARRRRKNKARA